MPSITNVPRQILSLIVLLLALLACSLGPGEAESVEKLEEPFVVDSGEPVEVPPDASQGQQVEPATPAGEPGLPTTAPTAMPATSVPANEPAAPTAIVVADSGAAPACTNCSEGDFSNANFSGIDLADINFSGADLSGASFMGSNVSGINFSGANLSGADFSGAYVSGCNMIEVDLSGARLVGTVMETINMSGANLAGADLTDSQFNGVILDGATMPDGTKN